MKTLLERMSSVCLIVRLLAFLCSSLVYSSLLVLAMLVPQTVSAITITEYTIPTASSYPWGITAGPDGNIWFTEYRGNRIGKITPSGSITEYPIPTALSQPVGITAGPDGNLWFTELQGSNIGNLIP
jgi:streptogramin lyase